MTQINKVNPKLSIQRWLLS